MQNPRKSYELTIGIPLKKYNNLSKQAIISAITAKDECRNLCIKCEVLIVSADSTCEASMARDSIANLRYIYQDPSGIYPAFNQIISHSRSDYILILGSDDYICDPIRLARTIAYIYQESRNTGKHPVIISAIYIGNTTKDWRIIQNKTNIFKNLRAQHINHPGMIVPSWVYNTVGHYNCQVGPEADYDFCLKLIKMKMPMVKVVKPFIFHRLGGISTSKTKNRLQSHARCCLIVANNFPSMLALAVPLRFISYLAGSFRKYTSTTFK